MPFTEICKKRITRKDAFPDCVYVTNKLLKFSEEFWKTQLGSAPVVRLFFNEKTNQVGMVPDKNHGYRVLIRNRCSIRIINWRSFVMETKLDFKKGAFFSVENMDQKSVSMRTFSVVKPTPV